MVWDGVRCVCYVKYMINVRQCKRDKVLRRMRNYSPIEEILC